MASVWGCHRGWVDPDRGLAGSPLFLLPMNGSSMLGWVVEVEAVLECAGEGHMRFPEWLLPRRADLGSLPRADWVLNK